MKKILLLSVFAISIFAAKKADAQATATSSFNIVLQDVMELSIGSASFTETFNSIERYRSGIIEIYHYNQISVKSTNAYKVTVKAGNITNPSSLDLSKLNFRILRSQATSPGNNRNTTRNDFIPSTEEMTCMTSTGGTYDSESGSFNATFDLEYALYEGTSLFGKAAGTNIIPLVFTLSAP